MSNKAIKKLGEIQCELKAPKGQRNTFGKYNYRSAEDILEALKPISQEKKVTFHLTEEIRTIAVIRGATGEEPVVVVEATATMFDTESEETISAKASAIIDLNTKGMQRPQQTGAASSYAKKYALGNLLLLDDTKDPDATNTHGGGEKTKVAQQTATAKVPAKKTAAPAAKKATITKKPAPVKPDEKPAPTAKTSGKADTKKPMTDTQVANFIKGIGEGKFDLVEKHLKNYAVDVNSKKVKKELDAAKSGETPKTKEVASGK